MLPEHFERLEGDEPLNDDVKAAFRSLFTMDLATFTQDDIDKFHNKMNLPERSPDEIRKILHIDQGWTMRSCWRTASLTVCWL